MIAQALTLIMTRREFLTKYNLLKDYIDINLQYSRLGMYEEQKFINQ